ncbi:MAG TPA: hypothetical protein VIO33_10605 [Burkholderiaceae bacterium]
MTGARAARLFCATTLIALPAFAGPAAGDGPDAARGRALFVGDAPLSGRIALHPGDLPAEVLRCANCHDSAGSPRVQRTVAPPLTRAWLIAPRERRGGPSSRYDMASFCRLLETGQDPAQLIVNVQMPRYAVPASDCAALWQYLVDEQRG